ncbi:hypothetical protein AAG906_002370 [Vitis piasezkii]
MKTPMSSSIKLDKDEKCKSIDSTMYGGMIGSLLYLTVSRPDIIYLKRTIDIGLWGRITRRQNAQKGFGFGFGMAFPPSARITTGFSSFLMHLGFRGKRPTEPSQPAQMEARRKVRFDTTLFSTIEDHQSGSREKYQFLPTATFRI